MGKKKKIICSSASESKSILHRAAVSEFVCGVQLLNGSSVWKMDWLVYVCVCVISTKVAYDGDVCVYRNGGDDECYVLGI